MTLVFEISVMNELSIPITAHIRIYDVRDPQMDFLVHYTPTQLYRLYDIKW
jgi:hypothetical protein